jgi:hypothetical protein
MTSNIENIDIDELIKNQWVIKSPVLNTSNYDYWVNQNTLDYNIALRNKPTVWGTSYYMWNGTITATWNKVITWIWFKPKLVEIICNNSSTWFCHWFWNWTSEYCNYYDAWAWLITTRIINFRNSWITVCQANLSSLDTDWFTINVTYLLSNTTYTFICHK